MPSRRESIAEAELYRRPEYTSTRSDFNTSPFQRSRIAKQYYDHDWSTRDRQTISRDVTVLRCKHDADGFAPSC